MLLNRSQMKSICIAIVAVMLMLAVPPYHDDGGLIGGTVYFPFHKHPSDLYISFNSWLLDWELSLVGWSLIAALIALRSTARKRQRKGLFVGLTIEVTVFLCCLPSFPYILGPEFTWYLLNLLAVILLGVILLLGRGRDVMDGSQNVSQ